MPVTIESVTAFLGWCTVINSAWILLTTVAMHLGRNWIVSFHARLFSIPESTVSASHFTFLANYKLLILMFNIVPYIALKLIY